MTQAATCVGAYAPGSYVLRKTGGEPDGLLTQQAMEDRTHGLLVALTGGEWRRADDSTPPDKAYLHNEMNWVVPFANALRHAYGIPEVGDGSKYADFVVRIFLATLYIKRVRAAIENGSLPMPPYDKWAVEDLVHFKAVLNHADRGKRPVLYMRGIPSPLAFKTFSGALLSSTAAYEELAVSVARRILRNNPDTVIQWELPAEMAFGSIPFASVKQREALLGRMMEMFSRIISKLPEGSQHSFHLCWGDLRRRPFVPRWLQSWRTNVALINAILGMSVWSFNGGTYRLFAIHDPHADARHAAKLSWFKRRAYRQVRAFPEHVIYAIGLLRPPSRPGRFGKRRTGVVGSNTFATIEYLEQMLDILGDKVHRFAVSTPCGEGRMDYKDSEAMWQVGVDVCEAFAA